MRIKSIFISAMLGLALQATAGAQSKPPAHMGFLTHTELGLGYTFVHSEAVGYNTGTTNFTLNGVSASADYLWRPHLNAVADFTGVHVNGADKTGASLTILASLVGLRYTTRPVKHLKPFVQVLAGEVHAGGPVYPANAFTTGGADTYGFQAGGGFDYAINHTVSIRTQGNYLMTGLPNGSSNRQDDLRLGAGFVFHFGNR